MLSLHLQFLVLTIYNYGKLFPLQIITGLQNFCRDNVASVVIAADKVGFMLSFYYFSMIVIKQ